MASWTEMSGPARGGVVAAVVAVLGGIGWAIVERGPAPQPASLISSEGTADPAAAAPAADPAAAAPAADPAAAAPAADPAAVAADPAALLAPAIDVLRVTSDGSTTLAGRTEARAQVSIRIDGVEVGRVAADAGGQFATVFTLAPSASARLMTLVATLADGTLLPATEGVAIAPVAEVSPTVVAAAEPAPESAAEPAAPAAIKVTEAGAAVLQPAAPVAADIASQVSLQVISYTAEGAVQLGGRGTAGASLRLYLDNTELASVPVGADGAWSLTTAAIAPGLYTLRIDQLDASGAVTSRLETPFKRETLEALAAASAPAPAGTVAEATVALADPATEGAAAEPAPTAAVASEPAAAEPVASEPATTEPVVAEGAAAEPAATTATTDVAGTAEAPAPDTTSTAGTAEAPAPDTAGTSPAADGTVTEPAVPAAAQAPAADTAPETPAPPITITVQPGFTLWAIAKETFGSGVMYVQVFEANKDKIRDPDLIYPGQVFSLPASP